MLMDALMRTCATCKAVIQKHTDGYMYCPVCNPVCLPNGLPTNQENITFKSGAASSRIPRFDLIPRQSLVELADRCALGLERHKEKSWNAASTNQAVLLDDEFIIARATHAIDHATKFIEKLRGQRPDDGDNDASAIMWAGMCLSQALHYRKQINKGTTECTSPVVPLLHNKNCVSRANGWYCVTSCPIYIELHARMGKENDAKEKS